MNILYDHQVFSWQRYGGISRYFYEIISRLCRVPDVRSSLFLGFHINEYGLSSFRDHYAYYWGVKRPLVPKTTKLITLANNVLFNLIAPTIAADIYHQTYYTCLMPAFTGKRIITVHDMIHEIHPEYFRPHDSIKLSKKKRESVKQADGVICISQSTKKDLMHYIDCPEHKVKVIYHGSALNINITAVRIIKEPYILYVGQRAGHKNFDVLLKAYARLINVKNEYKLVCFGGGAFDSREQREIASLNLSRNIVRCSGNDEVLANLYTYASVFVYPSLYEGFGIPPLEAMHYGCPVLASNASSIPEVMENAGVYFDPRDPDELMFNLDNLLSDGKLRDALIALGFQQEQKFSWDACARETLAFYRQTALV